MGEVSGDSRALCFTMSADESMVCRWRAEYQAQAEGLRQGEGREREQYEEVRPQGFAGT